jgi:hypothetical protein
MTSMQLPQAPASVENESGAPRFGTYTGSLDVVDLSRLLGQFQPNALKRRLTHKKWLYGFVATREVAALMAVVDVGYASNAFAMAVDLVSGKVLADGTLMGLTWPMVEVGPHAGAGLAVAFSRPDASLTATRPFGDERFHLGVRLGLPLPFRGPKLSMELDLLAAGAPPPLTVIAPVEGGIVNVTQKWAGMLAFGHLEAGGRRYVLDGGVGGMDYTNGFLARRTAWRWAFGCGRLEDGAPVGFNLVEGFNESRDDVNENAVWVDGQLFPVGRARFTWNKADVLDRWSVETTDGALELTFKPIALHREERDYKLIKSHFAQPLGLWEGTLTVGGREHRLAAIPGVAEEQDILW